MTGTRDQARAELARLATAHAAPVVFGKVRLIDQVLPGGRSVEHFCTAAPATVRDKQRPGFERRWTQALADLSRSTGPVQLRLLTTG